MKYFRRSKEDGKEEEIAKGLLTRCLDGNFKSTEQAIKDIESFPGKYFIQTSFYSYKAVEGK